MKSTKISGVEAEFLKLGSLVPFWTCHLRVFRAALISPGLAAARGKARRPIDERGGRYAVSGNPATKAFVTSTANFGELSR
jgi:hypothetical protein